MSMRCGSARRPLWPDQGPRLTTPETVAAQQHLEACPACRRFITEMTIAAEQVREYAPRRTAPQAVRERLFTTLARRRASLPAARRNGLRSRLGIIVAVMVTIAVGITGWARRFTGESTTWAAIATLAEDHVRALQDESIATSDPAVIRRWIAARVSFAVRVPEMPGAALEGARLCLLNGQRGAVLRFRVDGRVISYYVMREGGSADTPVPAERFLHGAEAGYEVVTWRAAGLTYALVGDLPRERLSALARACTHQAHTGFRDDAQSPLAYIPRSDGP